MWKCPKCESYRDVGCETCPSCGMPAPPDAETSLDWSPPPADRLAPANHQDLEDFSPRGVVLPADDPDAPTYLRTPAVPDLQSQWVAKAGRTGAWTGLGCGALIGGVSLTLTVHELFFGRRGSGEDVLLSVVLLVAGAPLAALFGAVAFSCLAICLEVPAAAIARRFRGGPPVRVPPRSALRRTDALAGRAPGGTGETAISGPPDDDPPKARDEIQCGDSLERREEQRPGPHSSGSSTLPSHRKWPSNSASSSRTTSSARAGAD